MLLVRVFDCHKRLFEGREEVDDDERPGRPVTVRIQGKVWKINEIVFEHSDDCRQVEY